MADNRMFLQGLLDVLYNSGNLDTLKDYNDTLRTLTEWFNVSSHFSVHIYGSGFGGYPQLLHFRESLGGNWRILHEINPQSAFFVSKHAAVLPTNAIEYQGKYPLLFYMTQMPSDPNLFKLWMSSRTHSLLLKNDYGLPLKESIVVRHDERKIPKFYLSQKILTANFRQEGSGNFLLFHRHSVASSFPEEKTQMKLALSVFDFREYGTTRRPPDGVYALKTLPAFQCYDWPDYAQEWVYRKRMWPNTSVIQEAMNKGVYLIPYNDKRHVDTTRDDSDVLWEMDFSAPTAVLVRSFTLEQRLILLFSNLLVKDDTYRCNVQLVLNKYEEQNIDQLPILNIMMHCLLFAFEECPSDFQDGGDTIGKVCKVLEKFVGAIKKWSCPNYFLPQSDILASIVVDDENIQFYVAYVDSLWKDYGKAFEVLKCCGILHEDAITSPDTETPSTVGLLSQDINTQLKTTLAQSLDLNIKLLVLQLFHNLHATDSIDKSITMHTNMLQALPKKDQPLAEFLTPLKFIISSSLGGVYCAKAATSGSRKSRKHFKTKAEEMLLVSTDIDKMSGKVRLANYYFMIGEMENVIECLEPLLKSVKEEEAEARSSPCADADLPSYQEVWLNRGMCFDIMFSDLETCIVLEGVEKCFPLAQNQHLGYVRYPVVTFDSKFYAGFLLAQAYAHVGKVEFCRGILLSLELDCDSEQTDLNEKRLVAYLNLLANVHLEIGNRGEALSLLQRSLVILSNPRNPARWKLFSIKTEKARKYIQWGLGVFAVTTATALGLSVLKPSALK